MTAFSNRLNYRIFTPPMTDEAFAGQDRLLARYLKPDLLIIDDMGIKQLPRKSGEYLFEIVMRRYETRSTMMTSNRPLEDWGKLIGDVPSASAILDRFLHHAEVISITGKSYRMKDRQARQTGDAGGAPADAEPIGRVKPKAKAEEKENATITA